MSKILEYLPRPSFQFAPYKASQLTNEPFITWITCSQQLALYIETSIFIVSYYIVNYYIVETSIFIVSYYIDYCVISTKLFMLAFYLYFILIQFYYNKNLNISSGRNEDQIYLINKNKLRVNQKLLKLRRDIEW